MRVLTNRSSGRQGHAIAEVAARRGADVVLVTASPLPLDPVVASLIERRDVETAREMLDSVLDAALGADVVVMAAAVVGLPARGARDVQAAARRRRAGPATSSRPTTCSPRSIAKRPAGQVVVGFAAETSDVVARGRAKLVAKGCDLLVVNDVSQPGAGFDHADQRGRDPLRRRHRGARRAHDQAGGGVGALG